jgi:hypothetical protein
VAEALAGASLTLMLVGTLEIPVHEAAGARAVAVDLLAAALAAVIALSVWRALRGGGAIRAAAPVLAALLLGVQAGSTHAVSQFEGAYALAAAEFLHMSGAAVWIGGIPYFLMALTDVAEPEARAEVARRFSLMSIGAVVALLSGGVLMGAFVSGLLARRVVVTVERGPRVSVPLRLATAFAGGATMAFGAALARGCTSGQALTGGALLNAGSWAFMMCVFGGAYAVAYPLRRLWR